MCAIALGLTACGGSGDKLAKLPGGRAAGPGFQFQLSGDWRALRDLRELSRVVTGSAAKQVPGLDVGAGTRGKAAQQAGLQGVDSFWSGHLGNGYSTNVNVGATAAPVKNLDTAARAIAQLERSTARRSGGRFKVTSLRRGPDLRLGGSRAALLEVGSSVAGSPLQQREVIALHASRLYRVTLSAQASREPEDERAFRSALKTWRWQD